MRPLRLTAALALAALAACGGGATTPTELHNQGLDRSSAGDFEGAVASFRAALDGAEPELALEIRKDTAIALCHLDPAEATDEFMALIEQHGDELNERDYMAVGRQLMDAKAFTEATHVVDAGIKNIGEAPKLHQLIDQIAKAAAASGDTGAMDALEGLGYIGD